MSENTETRTKNVKDDPNFVRELCGQDIIDMIMCHLRESSDDDLQELAELIDPNYRYEVMGPDEFLVFHR